MMTRAAGRFIGEVTLSALASEPVRTSLWDDDDPIGTIVTLLSLMNLADPLRLVHRRRSR